MSPSNISYLWNYGSLLGVVLIIQIATGVTLAMHYTPHVDLAFISVEHKESILTISSISCTNDINKNNDKGSINKLPIKVYNNAETERLQILK